ncbi:TIGR04255 family protein [Microcoleus sp. ARI1-B5]|uniref:TIGR04255 family protein n=1 Tax=unclassified Microcoleus TaxID=2642155 RepID=UPI002FD20C75
MSQPLKGSPLIEVLCEFRFAPSSAWDWTLPGRLYERIGKEFSEREQVNEVVFQLQPEADNSAALPQIINVPQRIQLKRPDQTAIVQVGPHILVVNHLAPYPLWENFRSLILRIFLEYIDLYGDFTLSGIGLRYINQIPISTEGFDVSNFITLNPNLTGVLDRSLSSFHQRYDLSYESVKAVLVHQTGINETQEGAFAVVLDLDFNSDEVDNLKEISEIQKWLDEAHQHLYEAFRASLNPDYYQLLKQGKV